MTPQLAVAEAARLLGNQAALAKAIGVKPPTVSQWASGERPVPVNRALQIDKLTKGEVDRKTLCPAFPWDLVPTERTIGAA